VAFGRAKEQFKTRVTLHLGGRDLDVWIPGDEIEAQTSVQMGFTGDKVLTLCPAGQPNMVIQWSAVPAVSFGETVPKD
jgi:hypothetical protein